MIPKLSDIKSSIDQLAKKISAPEYSLPTYGISVDDARPYIEVDRSGLLFYLAKERGIEIKRYVAKDMDDLLYQVFNDVTFLMATNYELSKRIVGQDFRRILFTEQERLLGVLYEHWKLRGMKKHEEILVDHPFDDHASQRAKYYQSLIKGGVNAGNEWLLACEKYPLPKK